MRTDLQCENSQRNINILWEFFRLCGDAVKLLDIFPKKDKLLIGLQVNERGGEIWNLRERWNK